MTEQAKELQSEYQREWRKRNAVKLRNYHKEYREQNREKINAKHREWRRKNPEKMAAYREAYWERKAAALRESEEVKL